jgi:hypothetical protein
MDKPKVMAGRNGNVVSVSRNPKEGYIMLEQMVPYTNPKTNFTCEKRRTALFFGFVDMLLNLKWKEGQEVTGRIVLTESLVQEKGMQPKMAGNTGVPCTLKGKQIYHKTEFSFDADQPDVLLRHDNNHEIAVAAKAKRDFDPSQV